MIGLTASTAASTDSGRHQGRLCRDRDEPHMPLSHRGGITHDEYKRMRELMFSEDIPEMERSSSSSSMLSVSSTSSCTSSLASTASSSKRRIFAPFWEGRREDGQDGHEGAEAGRPRGCHDWGLGPSAGVPGSHPFISAMSTGASSRSLSYEARTSFTNLAFDRISAFEAGSKCSESGTSSIASSSASAGHGGGGSAPCGESGPSSERCGGSQHRHDHHGNSSASGDSRDRRSIFTSSSFSQPAPPPTIRHFESRPEFRKAPRSASFTSTESSSEPSDTNRPKGGVVVRRSSLRSKGESSSRSDPNLRASVHFDPRVRVVEFRASEVQHAGNGWSRLFTYN